MDLYCLLSFSTSSFLRFLSPEMLSSVSTCLQQFELRWLIYFPAYWHFSNFFYIGASFVVSIGLGGFDKSLGFTCAHGNSLHIARHTRNEKTSTYRLEVIFLHPPRTPLLLHHTASLLTTSRTRKLASIRTLLSLSSLGWSLGLLLQRLHLLLQLLSEGLVLVCELANAVGGNPVVPADRVRSCFQSIYGVSSRRFYRGRDLELDLSRTPYGSFHSY